MHHRSWLFCPGHRAELLDKALGSAADALIFDLEDGVPPEALEAARRNVAEVLRTPRLGPAVYVRTHAVSDAAFAADVEAAAQAGLRGIVVAKVASAHEVREAEQALKTDMGSEPAPAEAGIVPMIESAQALLRAPAIATASPRVQGLLFGAEDYALDVGLPVTFDGLSLVYPRSAIVVAAAAAGISAIDRVFIQVGDEAGLQTDAEDARRLGFSGKAVIHPAQIDAVNRVFAPDAAELERARRIVAAFDAASATRPAVLFVDGRMIDRPILERARRALERARP